VKAIDFDGHIVLRATLNGDRIPICNVDNLEISLVSPDLPVRVKLPMDVDNSWRALPDIRAAELQCMQLSLSILSRHESEVYVRIENEKNTANYLQGNYNQEQYTSNIRSSIDTAKKHADESDRTTMSHTTTRVKASNEARALQAKPSYANDGKASRQLSSYQQLSPTISHITPLTHQVPDRFYQDDGKRSMHGTRKVERQYTEPDEKYRPSQRRITREKTASSSTTSSKYVPSVGSKLTHL
jgi:hypothetical protein